MFIVKRLFRFDNKRLKDFPIIIGGLRRNNLFAVLRAAFKTFYVRAKALSHFAAGDIFTFVDAQKFQFGKSGL